jgi:hypothetical protein
VPARALVSAAVEATLVIAVSHRVRASVRAATHLVAADLAAALRDQPAVEEAIAWAAVASAAGEAAEEAEVDADNKQTIDDEGAEPNKSQDQPDALATADDTRSESAIGILGERSADMTFSTPQ